jgi:thiamine pyrophosphate-dependent acetolactate synthase large subunit-like protein
MADDTHERKALNRRQFFAGATLAGAALATGEPVAAQTAPADERKPLPPTDGRLAREQPAGAYTPAEEARYFVAHPASDVMVDVIKSLDIDYVTMNAGSSFRGLHESLLNYGGNKKPELLTCVHEEQAVAMAHGYAKVAGKPIIAACHGTVGLQHAAMAVYNAWCDRVPVIVIAGNYLDGTERRVLEWVHSAQDCIAPVRDYIKWDDAPVSLAQWNESLVRAHKIATTVPMGPVALVADSQLQEEEVGQAKPALPRPSPAQPPRADDEALREAAKLLAGAETPVIVAERYAHDQHGVQLLIELAETLQAAVVNRRGRMNFPNTHHLNQGGNVVAQADVVLALEVTDNFGLFHNVADQIERKTTRIARPDAKLITLGSGELFWRSNYQGFGRYYGSDLAISGDAQASLPALIEAVKKELPAGKRRALDARATRWRAAQKARREQAIEAARYAWDASPVSTERLSAELWSAIRDRNWALVAEPLFPSLHEFWEIDQYHQYIGGSGGAGMGYGAPTTVGAAVAHRDAGRIAINIQKDGDLMYCPGSLWTAAHHRIPLLSVMHNNRAYHQELMHVQRMAARRRRGVDGSARTGNTLEDPNIDFATVAKGLGMWAAGPIDDPQKLGPVLREALAVVERGEPALVDVVGQPR